MKWIRCVSGNILSFGDSWAYGAELDVSIREQENYTGQLSQMLGIEQVKNFSEVGSSISHLQLQIRNALTSGIPLHDTIAIFFLTGQERFLFFDYRGDFASLTASGYIARPIQYDLRSQFDSIYNFYYKNIHSTAADIITLNTNILALQKICQHNGIKDYYISGWEQLTLWPEVDRSRIYKQGMEHCGKILNLDQNLNNPQYIVPCGTHPNAQGHKLIAQKLFEMIKSNSVDI